MSQENDPNYWHIHRHELRQGMVFKTNGDEIVRLYRHVPGGGSKWYVENWLNGWYIQDSTIEPSDLRGQPLPEPAQSDEAPGYWYQHRSELKGGMIFKTEDGETVRLDRTVPGDGTQWYVDHWSNGWFSEDSTIEPGDLRGQPLPEPARAGEAVENPVAGARTRPR